MIVRFEFKLTNNTAKKWAVLKAIESDMTTLCTKYNVGEFDVEYDDINCVKTVTLKYDSDRQIFMLTTDAGIFAGKNGLEVEVLSRVVLEDESLTAVQDIKKVLHLATYN